MLPNATKYTNKFHKKSPRNTELQGWKWIAIDFWTKCPEIKVVILVKLKPFMNHFFLFFDIPLLLVLFAFFYPYCKTVKKNNTNLQVILTKYDISGATVSL